MNKRGFSTRSKQGNSFILHNINISKPLMSNGSGRNRQNFQYPYLERSEAKSRDLTGAATPLF